MQAWQLKALTDVRRLQLVRLPLEDATPDTRMVESLAPMWDEERERCGGAEPPTPLPDPPRAPQPLSRTVDSVRAHFQVIYSRLGTNP